jgi:hypothetical protein
MHTRIIAVTLSVLALAGAAFASPLLQVKNGKTTIEFNDAFAGALGDCEVTRIKQGNLKPDGSRLRLPVSGGALDPDAVVGEVQHGGGVSVHCPFLGDGPVVALQNFTIDLLGDAPVITGLVTVSTGSEPVQRGRLPLFALGGEGLTIDVKGKARKVEVSGAELSLTDATSALLAELGIVVDAGTAIGEAESRFTLRKADKAGDDDDDDDDDDEDDEDEDDEDEDDEDD